MKYFMSSHSKHLFSEKLFFRFPYPLLRVLPANELTLLCYLINWGDYLDKSDKWFFCRMKQIMEELDISKPTQTRLMRALEQKNFIKTKITGWPPTRYISINWSYIDEQVDTYFPMVEKLRKKRTRALQKKKENNIQNGDDYEDMTDKPFNDEDVSHL